MLRNVWTGIRLADRTLTLESSTPTAKETSAMKSIDSLVRAALANRVRRGCPTTDAPVALPDDVELTPLEIVLVVLDVEQSSACAWPLDSVVGIRTVGELCAFFCGDAFRQTVVQSLAQYLAIEPDTIGLSTGLRDDLGMTTLDLRLVLMRLEDVARVEFPSATVSLVRTVGDLAELLRVVAGKRPARNAVAFAPVSLGATPQ
jgi:acyl carrier protein